MENKGSYVNSDSTACVLCNDTIKNCSLCSNSSNVIKCTQCLSPNFMSVDSTSCV